MADDAEVHSMGCAPAWWCGRPWNPSPLVRTSERMLFLLRAVVFGAIVLAVPLALTVGTEVYTDDVVRVRAEHASAVSVEATVLTEPEWTEAHDFEAQVRWDSGGAARTGTVPVPRTTDIGDRVSVWLDDQGAPTRAPRSPATAVFMRRRCSGVHHGRGLPFRIGTHPRRVGCGGPPKRPAMGPRMGAFR